MTTEWLIRKRPSVLGIISGALAGLVCITPGAGYMGITGAFVSGLLAGPTCFFACQLKKTFKFDDALDAFGIHGPGGILGGLLTGLFAKEEMTIGVFEPGVGVKGAFEGNAFQILLQLYGVAISIVWSMLGTVILLKLIDASFGLRVGVDEELLGLDMVCHGETVFPQNLGIEWQADAHTDASNKSGTGTTRQSGGGDRDRAEDDWHESLVEGERAGKVGSVTASRGPSRGASIELPRSRAIEPEHHQPILARQDAEEASLHYGVA